MYNALCAVTVGNIIGLSIEQIKKGIESFELTKKRMDITELKNGVTIINDSYNASFESMQASLKYLGSIKDSRKIAVLGDMFELGEYSEELHKKVGIEVARNKMDILLCCGDNSKYIAEMAKDEGLKEELNTLAYSLNYNSYNEIEVFEKYLSDNNYIKIDGNNILVSDLKLENGKYAIFAYKDDWYHMFSIIDNIIYDKNNDCLDLYVISIYKEV